MKKIASIFLLAWMAWVAIAQVSFANFTQTVPTAGTAVPMTTSSTRAVWGTIQALPGNTGRVCFGGPSVNAAAGNGTCLNAGQAGPLGSMPIGYIYDLSNLYGDALVNGEGFSITYVH